MSDPNGAASSSSAPAPKTDKKPKRQDSAEEEEDLETDAISKDIHEILKALRKREISGLAHDPTNLRSTHAAHHYYSRFFLETGRYIRYVFDTWIGLAITSCFGGLGPFDWFTMFFFAFSGTIVLFFVLVTCLIINSPILVNAYKSWSNKYGGGLGLVNSSSPNLFKSITKEQVEAATEFLSSDISDSKDGETNRYFNFDAAKLLLQFAAIVYEHPNESVREAVEVTANAEKAKGAGTNLLSLMPTTKERIEIDPLSDNQVNKALASVGDNTIRNFCVPFGIEFEPLSEMNSTSSAFCGVFWDPKSNWIVVSFKGTSPIEFGEWLSDLNTRMTAVGSHIPGFRNVHQGFKDAVYPPDVSKTGGVRPYDTISAGIKALAKWLTKNNGLAGKPKINVWFTGHSLGCATASLVYSRFLMRHKDMGKRSNLRDAYLFAAPILTDRDCVDVFNAKMMDDPKRPKTMWRITSNGDAVATCLPELGDYSSVAVSPNNGFAFAHLGTEIKLRDYPLAPNATGNHIYYGTDIHIESKFSKDEILAQRAIANAKPGEAERQRFGRLLQSIPVFGRLAAHGCGNYWDQLDRSAFEGTAEWVYN